MDEGFSVVESIEEYIQRELNRMWIDAQPYITHEVIWGVPCGPTLGMIEREKRIISTDWFKMEDYI